MNERYKAGSERAVRRRANPAVEPAAEADSHPLLNLQQQLGNAKVARMLAQRQPIEEEEEEKTVQRQPMAPEDEEDEKLHAKRDPALQREEEPEVGPEGGPISPELSGQINSRRGGGSSLDDASRTQMEQAFDADFSAVRVHTDSTAQQLNRSVGARAFTTGNDIFFGQGAGPSDHNLLAHELTHVVQQGDAAAGGPLTVGAADDAFEQEADGAAAAIGNGAPVQLKRDE